MPTPDPQKAEQKSHILVVEDDKITAQIMQRILSASDFIVTIVSDGESAIDLLSQGTQKFACILLDCILPGMTGLDVLRCIKEDIALRNIPVIICTALTDANNIRNAFKNEAFSYLIKPFPANLLNSVAHAAVDRHLAHAPDQVDGQQPASTLELLDSGKFHCRTLEDARKLAMMLAAICPNPDRVASGLLELFINGIEHGMLGIAYAEKTQLVLSESWLAEVERRLEMDCYRDRKVVVAFERRPDELELTISDDGPGFSYQCYLDFDPERALHPHGRGIAMTCLFNLEHVEFLGCGNTVRVRIRLTENADENAAGK